MLQNDDSNKAAEGLQAKDGFIQLLNSGGRLMKYKVFGTEALQFSSVLALSPLPAVWLQACYKSLVSLAEKWV